jgi:hypothetical protein
MRENAKTEEADTNVKVLPAPQPTDPLSIVIAKIQKAQMILSEPDNDGLRAIMVEPVLKSAVASLTEIYEKYRTKRKAKV